MLAEAYNWSMSGMDTKLFFLIQIAIIYYLLCAHWVRRWVIVQFFTQIQYCGYFH